jgi:ABC-type phosphate/phosphonate transport system substrate-binding protein
MYDWPEVSWANDALWSAIAERLNTRGIAAPARLDRTRPSEDVWRDPGLVLSQTCGYPFASRLSDKVRLVGTPIYEVDGCTGPFYSSFIITRIEAVERQLSDFRGRRIAFNARDSLSGYVAVIAAITACRLDAGDFEWVETGSHRASLTAVVDGSADLAGIDSVCWGLAGRHQGDAVEGLRILERTPLRPGLPFITAGRRSEKELATLRLALRHVLADPTTEAARAALFLKDFVVLDPSEYAPLADLYRKDLLFSAT